jgi:hypothetical protein
VAFDWNYFSMLGDASVTANALSRELLENCGTNAENVNRLLLRSWILSLELNLFR